MTSAFRLTIVTALLCGNLAATDLRAEDAPPAVASPTDEPTTQLPKKPRVLVTISKETTYITEPLRPDGYPDYVAALNKRFSEGVTPENNAAVLFWKAMGPGGIPQEVREPYFQMLGIPSLPDEGEYFVTSITWFNRHKAEVKTDADQPEGTCVDPLWEQQTQMTQRPWSKQEFPVLAGWVAANEKPLTLVIEASKRPKRYDPLISAEKGTLFDSIGNSIGVTQAHREVARALVGRAMLRVNEGEVDQALDDLLACHRLGRLMGQGPTLVEFLVGATIDLMACAGDQALLQHVRLSAAQAAKMRDDLANLAPMPRVADKIETCERYFNLDCIATVAREGSGSLRTLTTVAKTDNVVDAFVNPSLFATLDWDIILRMLNPWYDRLVHGMEKPTRVARQEELRKVGNDICALAITKKDIVPLGLMMLTNPREVISRQFGGVLVTSFIQPYLVCADAEDRATMQFKLTKLAFPLAQYRADHDTYPATLADLTPKYVAKLPKDLFTDGDLHYRQEGDGYLLYSVGVNGKDDDGKTMAERFATENASDWDDLVVRVTAK